MSIGPEGAVIIIGLYVVAIAAVVYFVRRWRSHR